MNAIILVIMSFHKTPNHSQYQGGNLNNVAYDTIVSTSSGKYSTQIGFSKLYPSNTLISRATRSLSENSIRYAAETLISKRNGVNRLPYYFSSKNIFEIKSKPDYSRTTNQGKTYLNGIEQIYSDGHNQVMKTKSIGPEKTDESKINIWSKSLNGVVGIKFVNIFSGKFLFQISNTQVQTVFSKELDVFRTMVLVKDNVTARNVLVEANRSNEPSVLCQSTFN
jgi:hypothetical protein